MTLNGINKSAILLMLLGSEKTIEIFKYLNLYEIHKVIAATIDIDVVSQEDLNEIFNDFMKRYKFMKECVLLNRDLYIKKIKSKFLNKKKSEMFLKKILNRKKFFKKINELNEISDKNLFDLLKDEHPYILTSILFFLDSKHSANIISYFQYDQQSEIICLIANFSGLEDGKISSLIQVINIILSKYKKLSWKRKSLITAINILHTENFNKDRNIFNHILKYDSELGKEILYETLCFYDIVKFTDDSMIELMKHVDFNHITIALYHEKQEIKHKFFKHCIHLKENIKFLESDKNRYISYDIIQNSQKLIISMAKKLLKKKKISIFY